MYVCICIYDLRGRRVLHAREAHSNLRHPPQLLHKVLCAQLQSHISPTPSSVMYHHRRTPESYVTNAPACCRRYWAGYHERRRCSRDTCAQLRGRGRVVLLLLVLPLPFLLLKREFQLIGCTSCIVKSFRSRRSFISSPLWTPLVYGPTS